MKILIISTVPFEANGITSVILNYCRNINKDGLDFDFLIADRISSIYKEELEKSRVAVYCLPRKSKPLRYLFETYKIMKKNQYDIVHVHGNSSFMILDILPAKLTRIPIRIVHAHNTKCSNDKLHKLLLPVMEKLCTNRFACGEAAGKWMYGEKTYLELKNGIDLRKYHHNDWIRQKYREKLCAGDKKVIGHVGSFVEQKNHMFILDMYVRLLEEDKNNILLLAGAGPLFEEIKEKAKEKNISDNIIFLGVTSEVDKYIQAMDVLLLPSLFEGLPVVLIEAQAAGLNCIVSDKVTREADLTHSMNFLSISDVEPWVEVIRRIPIDCSEREVRSNSWCEILKREGYDIVENANVMKKAYLEYRESANN